MYAEENQLSEREAETCYLGQFIPVHYHHNMLMDQNRMLNFRSAIRHSVFPGAKVLELGGGTGVLSFFAARSASRVYCVEFNEDMVREARRFLAINPDGEKVQVIHANAFHYLPPEPVDIVICEMIHVGMLREKQVEVIASFKQRYLARFGYPLPLFIPEAVIMALQPVQQDYDFSGFYAPIVQFQETGASHPGTVELGTTAVYSIMDFRDPVDTRVTWEGHLSINHAGQLNSLRFITKNVLAVISDDAAPISWLNHYMTIPLHNALDVQAGDIVQASLAYTTGESIQSLESSIRVKVIERQ